MIKRFFSQEWAKLKVMNFTDKRQYIWEYYKIHLIATGFALFMIGSLINIWFINPPRRDHFYVAWQAGHVFTETLDEMGRRLSVIVPDEDRYRVSVNSYVLVDEPQVDQALITRFSAMITVGDLHATIISREGIQEGAEFGILRSPAEVLTIIRELDAALYEELTGRLLTITYYEWHDEDAPAITDTMGIRVGGSPMMVDLGIMTEDLYLGVIVNSQQLEATAHALMVMFDVFVPEVEDYTP